MLDNVSDLLDVVLAPLDFCVVILRLGFGQKFVDRMDDVLADLAIFDSLLDRFVFGFPP